VRPTMMNDSGEAAGGGGSGRGGGRGKCGDGAVVVRKKKRSNLREEDGCTSVQVSAIYESYSRFFLL
jgi:hypothetical protein